MDFTPSKDLDALLETLREIGLVWIADEVVSTIREGQLLTKEFTEPGRRARKTGFEVIPFTDDEQLHSLINTLRNYFVILPQTWTEAQDILREQLQEPDLQISIVPPGAQRAQTQFGPSYQEHARALDSLLKRAAGQLRAR